MFGLGGIDPNTGGGMFGGSSINDATDRAKLLSVMAQVEMIKRRQSALQDGRLVNGDIYKNNASIPGATIAVKRNGVGVYQQGEGIPKTEEELRRERMMQYLYGLASEGKLNDRF